MLHTFTFFKLSFDLLRVYTIIFLNFILYKNIENDIIIFPGKFVSVSDSHHCIPIVESITHHYNLSW